MPHGVEKSRVDRSESRGLACGEHQSPLSRWLSEMSSHRDASLRARSAMIDGEIVCLEPDGRSNCYQLLFRRDWPYRLMQGASTVVEE